MATFWIYGAGAVGSGLAAYLSRAGHHVGVTARRTHAEAIAASGLSVTSYDETFNVSVEARTGPPPTLSPEAWIFLTVQSRDVSAALQEMKPLAAAGRVVTFQNGIRAEGDAAPFCPRLYGGIIRFTATMLEPGTVRLRRPGQIIVGKHPSGIDADLEELVGWLREAGFETAASTDIASDKALKLVVNLVSGPAVLMRRTGKEPALAAVQVALLLEAQAVYRAAGIRAEPVSGLGLPLEAMIERFRQGGSAPDGRPVYNSTWQNLYHRRSQMENRYYHGEIMRLGDAHGIPTPVNRRTLDLLEDALERGLGPEPYSPEAFREAYEGMVDFSTPPEPPSSPGDNLEI